MFNLFKIQITRRKTIEKVSSLQSRRFQCHNNDNNNTITNIGLLVDNSPTNGEEEVKETPKLISYTNSQSLEAL